jgi:hypothetical protein
MKLHLGCGQRYLQGYTNIDLPPEMHSLQNNALVDLYANIVELKYPTDSISEIRLHHVFEHFTRPVALALLASWYSWLNTEGILHIEVPNFYRQSLAILNPNASFSEQLLGIRHLFGSHEANWAVHCEGYSPQSLKYILEQYGYSIMEIRENEWRGTYNFEIISCKKTESKKKNEYLEITYSILSKYLLDSTEYRLLEIWLEMYKMQVERSWGLTPDH